MADPRGSSCRPNLHTAGDQPVCLPVRYRQLVRLALLIRHTAVWHLVDVRWPPPPASTQRLFEMRTRSCSAEKNVNKGKWIDAEKVLLNRGHESHLNQSLLCAFCGMKPLKQKKPSMRWPWYAFHKMKNMKHEKAEWSNCFSLQIQSFLPLPTQTQNTHIWILMPQTAWNQWIIIYNETRLQGLTKCKW